MPTFARAVAILACRLAAAGSLWVSSAANAWALRIVLSNDDGFASPHLQALFVALRAAGHDVILSAPYTDQSGMSAQLRDFADVAPTAAPALGGAIPALAPGIGPTTLAPDQYYVNATPATAASYGFAVLAPRKWGAPPDLVICGPNDGNNLGVVTPHSGTVGAVVTALNRGIPAIAVSAAPGNTSASSLLAEITLRVVAAVTRDSRVLLPAGIGLSVNAPALDARRSAVTYRFAFTQVGPGAPAATEIAAVPPNENTAFDQGETITISAIEGTYQANLESAVSVLALMQSLFAARPAVVNPKFTNVAIRGPVGTGDAVQVLGFVIAGTTRKTVLVRATGPSLAGFGITGALVDPTLTLFDRVGNRVAQNDNWCDDSMQIAALEAAAARAGAFAWNRDTRDAALIVTLAPGNYSAVVAGAGNATGIALVEVFDAGID